MAYDRMIDGALVPYLIGNFRKDFPSVLAPKNNPDPTYALHGVYRRSVLPRPDVTEAQTMDRAAPELVDGVSVHGWTIRDKTPEELEAEAGAIDAARVLTPARFAYLLAATGLEDVWEAMEAYTKENDPNTYAILRANGAAASFHLVRTLAILAQLKPLTDAVAPSVDLSEATIRTAWATAEQAEI